MLLSRFCSESDFHGLSHITAVRKSRASRAFWLLMFASSALVLCYLVTDRILYFFSYPYTTKSEVSSLHMPLPAVTVCADMKKEWLYSNLEPEDLLYYGEWLGIHNFTYVNGEDGRRYVKPEVVDYFSWLRDNTIYSGRRTFDINRTVVPHFYEIMGIEEEAPDRDITLNIATLLTNHTNQGVTPLRAKSVRDTIRSSSVSADELIVECQYATAGVGGTCTSTHVFTNLGNCYTINFGNHSHPVYSLSFQKVNFGTALEEANFVKLTFGKRVYDKLSKVRVLLHEPSEYPSIALTDKQIVIGKKQEKVMSVIKATKSLSLGPPYVRDCQLFSADGEEYSWSRCVRQCTSKKMLVALNCTFYYMIEVNDPESPDAPICSYSLHQQVKQKVVTETTQSILGFWGQCQKTCPHHCNSDITLYLVDETFNFRYSGIFTIEPMGMLVYETIFEEPLYPTAAFFAEVGGLMGVLVGASILTIVHLLEFILASAYNSLYGKQKK